MAGVKRSSNKVRAERMKRSHDTGLADKLKRNDAQERRHKANVDSGTSPWSVARAARRARRAHLKRQRPEEDVA